MKNMYTIKEIEQLINDGRKLLLLAAEEEVLEKLPKGNWIAGSIPYFMSEEGGIVDQKRIFAQDMTDIGVGFDIKSYHIDEMKNIYSDLPDNGFGIIIIPGFSEAHASFANNAPTYPKFAKSPLAGWIAGIHLDDIGKKAPVVWHGQEGRITDAAVVMGIEVSENKSVNIDIVNLFEQGEGDTIVFNYSGFKINEAIVNGENVNFSEYLKANNVDSRWPLVANYEGAFVNVGFQEIDEENKVVNLYAPVFENVEYKLAKPIEDYTSKFEKVLPMDAKNAAFSCNCILNFLYGDLEGKKTSINGPMTFGEIAYQLLNQTMVFVSLED